MSTQASKQDLFRVLYCSRNLIERTGQKKSDALHQILHSARLRNSECGITGALLFSTEYFAQVLEGPKLAIENTFERIQRDDRHNEVTVLECSDIGSRDFPDWSMARVAPLTASQEQAAQSTLISAMGDPTDAGHSVLELMRTLLIEQD